MVSKSSSWVKNILIVISWNGENIHATLICVWGGKTLYMTLYLTFAIFVKKNTCSRIKVFVLFTPLSSSIPSLLLGESLLAKKFTGTLCQAGALFQGTGILPSASWNGARGTPGDLTPVGKGFSAASTKKGWAGTLRGGERGRKGWYTIQSRLCVNYNATPGEQED